MTPEASEAGAPDQNPPPSNRRRWLAALLVLAAAAGCFEVWRGLRTANSVPPLIDPPASVAEALTSPDDAPVRPGPWGDLRIQRISLERPDEFISLPSGAPPPVQWQFPGHTEASLGRFFASVPLGSAEAASLRDPTGWEVRADGITVRPPAEVVLSLSREARGAIYNELARFSVNTAQFHAFRQRRERLGEWLSTSGLSQPGRRLFESFLYDQGPSVCLADYFEVAAQLSGQAERRRFIKTLSREPAVLLTLHLDERSDIDGLVRYWAIRGRAKDIRPLLESVARQPGGGHLDVVHLLPPFARQRLYTYPFPTEDPAEPFRDCTWSALNFFSSTPEDRLGQPATAMEVLAKEYYPIKDAPRYGDILCLYAPERRLLHTMVYIADRFVFTKNGAYFSQPWLIADVNDVLARYSTAQGVQVIGYRSKQD